MSVCICTTPIKCKQVTVVRAIIAPIAKLVFWPVPKTQSKSKSAHYTQMCAQLFTQLSMLAALKRPHGVLALPHHPPNDCTFQSFGTFDVSQVSMGALCQSHHTQACWELQMLISPVVGLLSQGLSMPLFFFCPFLYLETSALDSVKYCCKGAKSLAAAVSISLTSLTVAVCVPSGSYMTSAIGSK